MVPKNLQLFLTFQRCWNFTTEIAFTTPRLLSFHFISFHLTQSFLSFPFTQTMSPLSSLPDLRSVLLLLRALSDPQRDFCLMPDEALSR